MTLNPTHLFFFTFLYYSTGVGDRPAIPLKVLPFNDTKPLFYSFIFPFSIIKFWDHSDRVSPIFSLRGTLPVDLYSSYNSSKSFHNNSKINPHPGVLIQFYKLTIIQHASKYLITSNLSIRQISIDNRTAWQLYKSRPQNTLYQHTHNLLSIHNKSPSTPRTRHKQSMTFIKHTHLWPA